MKRTFWIFIALVAVAGCDPKPQADPAPENPSTGTTAQSPESGTASGSGSGGVTPMGSMGAGGMTPVAGAESVQGGGSGVGQAAKDQARRAAGNASSSAGQMSGDE